MRVPDRNNYEIWIIDWLDGNLSVAEEAELMAFLAKNPDIKEESGLVIPDKLIVADYTMNDKEHLKKSTAELEISQIDLLSVAHLENDITAEQSAELQKCIEENDVAAQRFTLIQKLKLKPTGEVYINKKSLKKTSVPVRILRIVSVTAAAAAVLTFILFFSRFEQDPLAQNNYLAEELETSITLQETESETPAVNIQLAEDEEVTPETVVDATPVSIPDAIINTVAITTPVGEPTVASESQTATTTITEPFIDNNIDLIAEIKLEDYIVYEYWYVDNKD